MPTNSDSDTSFDSQSTPLEIINQGASSNHTSTTSSSVNFYANPENIFEKQTITIHSVHCVNDKIKAFSDENTLDANTGFRCVLENGELEVEWEVGLLWTVSLISGANSMHQEPLEPHTRSPLCIMPFKKGSGKLLPIVWPLDGRDLNPYLFSWLPHFLTKPFPYLQKLQPYGGIFQLCKPHWDGCTYKGFDWFQGSWYGRASHHFEKSQLHHSSNRTKLTQIVGRNLTQELVQQPAFIIKCWKPVLETIGDSLSCMVYILGHPQDQASASDLRWEGIRSPNSHMKNSHRTKRPEKKNLSHWTASG